MDVSWLLFIMDSGHIGLRRFWNKPRANSQLEFGQQIPQGSESPTHPGTVAHAQGHAWSPYCIKGGWTQDTVSSSTNIPSVPKIGSMKRSVVVLNSIEYHISDSYLHLHLHKLLHHLRESFPMQCFGSWAPRHSSTLCLIQVFWRKGTWLIKQ